MSSLQDNAVDFIWWRPFYLQCQRTGDIIRLDLLANHFAMKRGYKYRERLKFYRLLVCQLLQQNWWKY